MQPHTPDVELRLSELQTQIDRLSLALRQWREHQEQSPSSDARLAELTAQSAEILRRWSITDEKQGERTAALEARLQQDLRQRIQQLEQLIEREWQSFRRVQEEPVKLLREQAESLGETCVAAANLALRGFDRAEARIAALEADLQTRMSQLSYDVRAAVAQVQGVGGRTTPSPFPLESVMRIHEDLREPAASARQLPEASATAAPPAAAVPQLPDTTALSQRLESLERELTSEKEEIRAATERTRGVERTWRSVAMVLVLALAGLGTWVGLRQSRLEATLSDASSRAAAAERDAQAAVDQATQQMVATRTEAERQIADARQAAARADIISGVLAAPDLRRFALAGSEAASRAFAQVLWSRTRGLVVSASRLPPAPSGMSYQLWFLTSTTPVSGAVFAADAGGTATVATDSVPQIPRLVTGVLVTLEPSPGSSIPSGTTVLTRIIQ